MCFFLLRHWNLFGTLFIVLQLFLGIYVTCTIIYLRVWYKRIWTKNNLNIIVALRFHSLANELRRICATRLARTHPRSPIPNPVLQFVFPRYPYKFRQYSHRFHIPIRDPAEWLVRNASPSGIQCFTRCSNSVRCATQSLHKLMGPAPVDESLNWHLLLLLLSLHYWIGDRPTDGVYHDCKNTKTARKVYFKTSLSILIPPLILNSFHNIFAVPCPSRANVGATACAHVHELFRFPWIREQQW